MEITEVASSNIKKIGYIEEEQKLLIIFHNDTAYEFYGINSEIFENFKNSSSIGKFFNTVIKNKFNYRRVG